MLARPAPSVTQSRARQIAVSAKAVVATRTDGVKSSMQGPNLQQVYRESDRKIMQIALPTLGSLAAEPMASLVATMWISRLGTLPLAACAAAASIFSLATKLINIPLMAVSTSLVANASAHGAYVQCPPGKSGECSMRETPYCNWRRSLLGENGKVMATHEQRVAISSTIVLGFLVGAIQGLLLLAAAKPLLQVWCTSHAAAAATVDAAQVYLVVRAIGAPLNSSLLVLQAACRGMGRAGLSFQATLVANAFNLILDPLLIFGFKMGLFGAASATVIGQAASVIYLVTELLSMKAIGTGNKRSGNEVLFNMFALIPSTALLVLRSSAIISCFAFATATVTRLGTVEAAAHTVCFQVWLAASLLADSLAVAAQTLIAQSVKTDPRDALYIIQRTMTWAIRMGAALAAILLVARPVIPILFTSSAAMHALVIQMFWWVIILQPVNALAFVWDGILYGVSGFRYAAYVMPLNVMPAIACMLYGSMQKNTLQALSMVWAGLAVVMVLRFFSAWIPFQRRAFMFKVIPRQKDPLKSPLSK